MKNGYEKEMSWEEAEAAESQRQDTGEEPTKQEEQHGKKQKGRLFGRSRTQEGQEEEFAEIRDFKQEDLQKENEGTDKDRVEAPSLTAESATEYSELEREAAYTEELEFSPESEAADAHPEALLDRLLALQGRESPLVCYAKLPCNMVYEKNIEPSEGMHLYTEEELAELTEIDGVIRKRSGQYEVIAMRPMSVAVVELTDAEAEMIRLDEALKSESKLPLSKRLCILRREAEILTAEPKQSLLRSICQAEIERPVETVLAEFNEVKVQTIQQALTASKLLPELLVLVDRGLSVADGAILAQMDIEVQKRVWEVIQAAGLSEDLSCVDRENLMELCRELKQDQEASANVLKAILLREKVYRLTESELQQLVQRLARQELQQG